jgi:hypothetical protein
VSGTLALDLATRSGWAFGSPGCRPACGSIDLPRGGGTAALGAVNAALADALGDLLKMHKPTRLIFEAPAMHMAGRSPHTARLLIYLAGVTELVAYRWSLPCFEAQVQTVRAKLAIKRREGEQWKPAVIRWCQAQGWQPRDDNQADALALLAYSHLVMPQRSAG